MRLARLANTRPDIVLEISRISQGTSSRYEKDITNHSRRLDKAIKYVHDYKESIHIHKYDCNSLKITAYSDAAYANNSVLSSHLGRIAPLTNHNHNSIPVSYKSCKSRLVARSILSAEVIALADLFDDMNAIRKQLEFVLR